MIDYTEMIRRRVLNNEDWVIPNPFFYTKSVLILIRGEVLEFMLFTLFKRKVKESPLIQEIDRYLLSRSSFLTRNLHRDWLVKFAQSIGVETSLEVLETDFDTFIYNINTGNYRESEKISGKTALTLFRNYLHRQNNPQRRVGRPAKIERNLEMFLLRNSNPTHWTYDRLAKRYRVDKRVVWEIVKREEEKQLDI